jgi:hypothetical protein
MARRFIRRNSTLTTSLYIDISEVEGTALEAEILVDFDYTPGQRQTYTDPGYGPEVTDWTWRFADDADNVPLPMIVHAAIESFVSDQMVNDPHGWVEKAIDMADY